MIAYRESLNFCSLRCAHIFKRKQKKNGEKKRKKKGDFQGGRGRAVKVFAIKNTTLFTNKTDTKKGWRFFLQNPQGLTFTALVEPCAAPLFLHFFFLFEKGNHCIMENPFEIIIHRLNRIEMLIQDLNAKQKAEMNDRAKAFMDINELATYLGLAKQTIYGFTSSKTIPHFKKGKKIFFRTDEIDEWLAKGKVKTTDEINEDVMKIVVGKRKL